MTGAQGQRPGDLPFQVTQQDPAVIDFVDYLPAFGYQDRAGLGQQQLMPDTVEQFDLQCLLEPQYAFADRRLGQV